MNTLLTLSIGMLIGATLMTIVAVIHVDEANQQRERRNGFRPTEKRPERKERIDEEYQKGFKDGYNEVMKDIGG